jgi:hypothetical protein
MSATACANCGAALAGPFCSRCGQHDSAAHPATLGHLFHELTHELLHVDGKIWRTLKALFLEPGRLTQEYWRGRRAGWIGPFRVFLIAAALLLVFVRGIGPLNFQTIVQRAPSGELNVNIGTDVDRFRGRDGLTPVDDLDAEAYATRIRGAYAGLRYLAVPIFALVTLALYRQQQAYYASHIVLAVHFYAFWYALSLATAWLTASAVAVAAALASAGYLVLALRRLFREALWRSLVKGLVLYVVMIAIELGLAFAAAAWVGWTTPEP